MVSFIPESNFFFKNGEKGALAPTFPSGFFDPLIKKKSIPGFYIGVQYTADDIMKLSHIVVLNLNKSRQELTSVSL
ncbi:hypothetical protein, partial [Salmonella enterica]|uniref:hypothetical protein n=1 Tax=Salmonella enterica TaxID=28901 RepID=UPI002A747D44